MPQKNLFIPSPRSDRAATAPNPTTALRRQYAERARQKGHLRPGQPSNHFTLAQLRSWAEGPVKITSSDLAFFAGAMH